jgi:hypothetical protein
MISFPTPYADELLYSVFARYHIRSGNINHEPTLRELFGKVIYISNIDLPFCVGKLINNMPITAKYTVDDIIMKHTMYPLYTAFLSKDNTELIYNSMIGDNGSGLYIKSGMMTSSIKRNNFLRFCSKCFEEDMNKYGESYWRRIHQVPGIIICSKHKSFLIDSRVSIFDDCKRGYLPANKENCIEDINCFQKIIEVNKNFIDKSKEDGIASYIIDKSIALSNGVEYLLNNRGKNQDLQFFINKYIDALKNLSLTTEGGYICPDKLQKVFADYYGELFLKITQSELNINSNFNWLKLFFRKNKSIRHPIRHLLFCQFAGINLEELFNYNQLGIGRVVSKVTYEPYRKKEDVRKEWLKLIEENPGKSRGELSQLNKGNHIWLLRYDKQWYDNVSPKRKKMIVQKDKKDWNKIDTELFREAKKFIDKVLLSKEKPIRITKGYILKNINDNKSIKTLDKLPLTKKYIASVTETLEAYRDRKAKWAIEQLIEEGQNITMWKIIRKMGIGKNITEQLECKVVNKIESIIIRNIPDW